MKRIWDLVMLSVVASVSVSIPAAAQTCLGGADVRPELERRRRVDAGIAWSSGIGRRRLPKLRTTHDLRRHEQNRCGDR
jgi:hypothetical protein